MPTTTTPPRPIQDWKKGDKIQASRLQDMVDRIRQNQVAVLRGTSVSMPNGTTVVTPKRPPTRDPIIGHIVTAGPNGEADVTGEQYWVQIDFVPADIYAKAVDILADTSPDRGFRIVLVTNLCERQPGGVAGSGTHGLPTGTPIKLEMVYGNASAPDDAGSGAGSVTPESITYAQARFVTFTSTEGMPQYTGMARLGVSDNTKGWAYVFCHNLTS